MTEAHTGCMRTSLPDAQKSPLLTIDETAPILGLGRSACYEAAKRGEIPTLRFRRRLRVPTARLLEMLGVDGAGR